MFESWMSVKKGSESVLIDSICSDFPHESNASSMFIVQLHWNQVQVRHLNAEMS